MSLGGLGEEAAVWVHAEQGLYRRRDGKGVVEQLGSHEWEASADVGDGLKRVGIGFSGANGRHLVDDALSKGKIPSPPKVTPGTLLEQVIEKIRVAGLLPAISVRVCPGKRIEGVVLGVGVDGTFDVSIVVNEWGFKPGQRSYQVFDGRSRISNHDDQRWKYPQKGEEALDEAVAEAVKTLVLRGLGHAAEPDDEDDEFDADEEDES
jgi:hypothetical protein